MDILDKLVASSMDLHNPVPHNINIYFDTLKERKETEEYKKLIDIDVENVANKAVEKMKKEMAYQHAAMDEENNAKLNPEPTPVPFVDLIF